MGEAFRFVHALLKRFSSRCRLGDSSKTQIPFGNDKQRKLHLRGNSYKADLPQFRHIRVDGAVCRIQDL